MLIVNFLANRHWLRCLPHMTFAMYRASGNLTARIPSFPPPDLVVWTGCMIRLTLGTGFDNLKSISKESTGVAALPSNRVCVQDDSNEAWISDQTALFGAILNSLCIDKGSMPEHALLRSTMADIILLAVSA